MWIKETIKEILFFTHAYRYVMKNHSFNSELNYKNHSDKLGKGVVLCNGPSLKDALKVLQPGEDYVVVNYFGLDDNFLRLKPKYYCLADGMFFISENNKFIEKINKLRELFNNQDLVNWPLTIFVPAQDKEPFLDLFKLHNPNVKVIGVNVLDTELSIRHKYYLRGWACPMPQTVANLAIYVLINIGYKQIDLYGVDHTFTDGLCVNDDNIVCHTFKHYYEDRVEVKPVQDCFGNRHTLSAELNTLVKIFRSHEKLEEYSKIVGCEIINRTKGSMIDSYKRG